jgi:hypothetical protein
MGGQTPRMLMGIGLLIGLLGGSWNASEKFWRICFGLILGDVMDLPTFRLPNLVSTCSEFHPNGDQLLTNTLCGGSGMETAMKIGEVKLCVQAFHRWNKADATCPSFGFQKRAPIMKRQR